MVKRLEIFGRRVWEVDSKYFQQILAAWIGDIPQRGRFGSRRCPADSLVWVAKRRWVQLPLPCRAPAGDLGQAQPILAKDPKLGMPFEFPP